jgi:octaprenyl-diphosphate synthase
MSDLDNIKAPIIKELSRFESYFRDILKSNIPLLDIITRYILRRKGKQIRPSMVILSASLFGRVNEMTYTAASLIELLHTASLVHDDVVDDSYERRGYFSLNALWKSKLAVLTGDFLLAKGVLISVEKEAYSLLAIVSEAVREMTEGEILQIRKIRNLNISMDDYFEIIRKKTAALFAACAACGAKSVNAGEEEIKMMKKFGELTGIAFQIKDDLFDYQRDGKIGKPTANDLNEKKMTLPLLYSLEVCSKLERQKIRRLIKNENHNSAKIDEIIEFVKKKGGIEYAENMMSD